MHSRYTTIDLCSGIGGIRRGFELTGKFENRLSCEIDSNASRVYAHLYGEVPEKDVTSDEFLGKAISIGQYDVLLAGFPCQAFSSVGKQEGFKDRDRGNIFFSLEKIIDATRPRGFLLENVQNLVSHDKGNTIRTIVSTLEDTLDYKVVGVTRRDDGSFEYSHKSLVRNSRNFGLPQNRPRTYLIGFDRKYFGNRISLIRDELPIGNNKIIYKDVNSILEACVDDHYYLSAGYLETLEKHKIRQKSKGFGFGYCVVNQDNHSIANTIMATGGSGKERNLVFQDKEGVPGKIVAGKHSPLNSKCIRVMTPLEWGRLQGFVGYAFMNDGMDTFSFPEKFTDGAKYKVFGNSVTIPVIETMAQFIVESFETMGYSLDI